MEGISPRTGLSIKRNAGPWVFGHRSDRLSTDGPLEEHKARFENETRRAGESASHREAVGFQGRRVGHNSYRQHGQAVVEGDAGQLENELLDDGFYRGSGSRVASLEEFGEKSLRVESGLLTDAS